VQRPIDERAIPGGLAAKAALPIRRRWIMLLALGSSVGNDFIIFIVGGVGDTSTYCSHRNDHCWYAETGGSSFRDQDSSVSSPGPEAKRRNRRLPVVEPMTVEEVERIIRTFEEDNGPKHSPGRAPGRASAPTSVCEKYLTGRSRSEFESSVENAAVGSQASNRLTNVPPAPVFPRPAKNATAGASMPTADHDEKFDHPVDERGCGQPGD